MRPAIIEGTNVPQGRRRACASDKVNAHARAQSLKDRERNLASAIKAGGKVKARGKLKKLMAEVKGKVVCGKGMAAEVKGKVVGPKGNVVLVHIKKEGAKGNVKVVVTAGGNAKVMVKVVEVMVKVVEVKVKVENKRINDKQANCTEVCGRGEDSGGGNGSSINADTAVIAEVRTLLASKQPTTIKQIGTLHSPSPSPAEVGAAVGVVVAATGVQCLREENKALAPSVDGHHLMLGSNALGLSPTPVTPKSIDVFSTVSVPAQNYSICPDTSYHQVCSSGKWGRWI